MKDLVIRNICVFKYLKYEYCITATSSSFTVTVDNVRNTIEFLLAWKTMTLVRVDINPSNLNNDIVLKFSERIQIYRLQLEYAKLFPQDVPFDHDKFR